MGSFQWPLEETNTWTNKQGTSLARHQHSNGLDFAFLSGFVSSQVGLGPSPTFANQPVNIGSPQSACQGLPWLLRVDILSLRLRTEGTIPEGRGPIFVSLSSA